MTEAKKQAKSETAPEPVSVVLTGSTWDAADGQELSLAPEVAAFLVEEKHARYAE